jgi:NTP pyrophosphatase (non-canonical NTP hydrolase)
MTFQDYQVLAEHTSRFANEGYSTSRLCMSALGLGGESGEVEDKIKKIVFHNHPVNEDKLLELLYEIGDVLWYIAELCTTLNASMDSVAELNISKLAARYGTEFSSEKSINRKE